MATDDLAPEFLALPLGRNGLPDILIISKVLVPDHAQAVVSAQIVDSDPASIGFWYEQFSSHGKSAMKWARLFALERVRQRVVSLRSNDPTWTPEPLTLTPFTDWETLSVQRELNFYPMLYDVAGRNASVLNAINANLSECKATVTQLHYQLDRVRVPHL